MKKTILVAAALVAMVSCNKTLIETPVSESDYGYINLGISADTEMIETKASVTDDALNNYRVVLKKDNNPETVVESWSNFDGNVNGYLTYSTVTNPINADILWKVPAGKYKIYVENKEENNCYTGVGEAYINGVGSVDVVAGISTECSVSCAPKNSKVTAVYGDKFAQSFKVASLNFSIKESDTRIVPLVVGNGNHDAAAAAFFKASTTLTWTLIAELANDDTDKTYTSSFTTEAGKWTKITFNSGNTTDGKISITITADDGFNGGKTYTYELDPFSDDVTTSEGNW